LTAAARKKKKEKTATGLGFIGEGDALDFASAFSSPATRMAARPGARSAVEAAKRLTATVRDRQAAAAGLHCSSLTVYLQLPISLDSM